MPQAVDDDGWIWQTDAQGNAIGDRPVGRQGQSPAPVASNPLKVRDANAGYGNTVANTQGKVLDNTVTAATAPAVITKTNAEATKAEQGTRFNGLEGAQFSDALNQFNGALETRRLLGDLKDRYKEGPGKTKGVWGLADYVPGFLNASNERFDKSAGRLRAFAKAGTGTTGGENNSLAEMKLNLGSYIPSTYDKDKTNEDTFKAIDDLSMKGLNQAIQRLGGVPDGSGNIVPLGSPQANDLLKKYGVNQQVQGVPNVWDQVNAPSAPTLGALPAGSSEAATPIPDAMKQEYAAYYAQNAGNLDPQEYAAFRQSLAQKYNFAVPPDVDLQQEAATYNDYYAKGGRSTPNLEAPDKVLSELEMLRNSVVNNPLGAGAANFADGVSLGGVSALAGDKMQALRGAQPIPSALADIAGSIAGSEGLGMIGRNTLGRLAPKMMGGGYAPTIGRQIAQDAAYGGAYGQNANGDALTGAVLGGVGSLGGQAIGKAGGAAIGGLKVSPQVQALLNAKIPLTTGARIGGIAKSVEDRMMSVPGIGDLIRNRNLESVRGYNAAEFADTGAGIGANPKNIGEAGIRELKDANSAYYSKTLDPARIDTNDPQFIQDVAAARSLADSVIPNVKPTFPRDYSVSSLNNRIVDPVDPNGMMSGRNFQESYKGLARDARTRASGDYGKEIGDVARQGQDALASVLERQNPGAFAGFKLANTTNRRIATLEDAVTRARNGTRSGEPDVFMPSQYIDAVAANAKKFPGGLDTSLAKNAQQVIPSKIPDSGTGGRMAQFAGMTALPTVLGGGGAAADYMGVTDNGARNGLLLAALLAGGGTKGGQAVLNKGLFSRPAAAKKIGGMLGSGSGYVGSGLIPLLMQYQRAAEAQQ